MAAQSLGVYLTFVTRVTKNWLLFNCIPGLIFRDVEDLNTTLFDNPLSESLFEKLREDGYDITKTGLDESLDRLQNAGLISAERIPNREDVFQIGFPPYVRITLLRAHCFR